MQALATATDISFKNILFLTDFTEASQAALSFALGFARHYKAQLFPAHACDPVILTETTSVDVIDKVVDNSRKELERLAANNKMTGPALFTRGPLESAFPRWVDEHGIDLVVVGTHGRRGLQRFLLGSTAEFIFRNATCPVLTVGPHVALRPYNGFTADKILCPTDLGSHAEFAATYALSFARENRARLTFMHVVPLDEVFQHDCAAIVNVAREKLAKLIPDDAKLWCKPEMIVEVGEPALEVQRYAEKERPDLIVLGLPAHKEFNAHFRSGVTYRLVSSAPCPVLTVRDMTR